MEISKSFERAYFPAQVIREAIELGMACADSEKIECQDFATMSLKVGDYLINYDDLDEFFSDYDQNKNNAVFHCFFEQDKESSKLARSHTLYLRVEWYGTNVSVTANSRGEALKMLSPFEQSYEQYRREPEHAEINAVQVKPNIFLGHGKNEEWRKLKDHLSDKHGYQVTAFETGARAGHHVRDILEGMASEADFALIVLTGDDETEGGNRRPRQNAVHEVGLFQGKLGFNRAVVLAENGIEMFSNLDGVQQIRFDPGVIEATFGDVIATLNREFEAK